VVFTFQFSHFGCHFHDNVLFLNNIIGPCVHLQVRDAVGTADDDSTFGVASTLGIKGHVTEMIRNADGTTSSGEQSVGFFKGSCTVVSRTKGERFCTYEISLSSSFLPQPPKTEHKMGAVIVTGPVLDGGDTNTLIVTAAEFELQSFHGGTFKTRADPELPVLYAWLDLMAY
jgi:hypothetical protein